VASGIGFIRAGTIILRREVVKGLTTAASIWAVAAVGLAVGGHVPCGRGSHFHGTRPPRARQAAEG
jgi:hypothetical protein